MFDDFDGRPSPKDYGKYHWMASFEDGEPKFVIISYVGKGGEILSRKWSGVERLPTS